MEAAQQSNGAIVVGGSSGIGQAVASMLMDEGLRVTVAARDRDRLEAAGEAIGAETIVADVTDPDQCRDLVERHLETAGRLDVLINSAGQSDLARIESITAETWKESLAINLGAVFNMTQAALPELRKHQGLIVSLASVAASGNRSGLAAYSAAKAALIALMHTVNAENHDRGVRATSLSPGFVDTALTRSMTTAPMPPEQMIRAQDCAECVRLLLRLSPHAHISDMTVINQRPGT
jgi:NADP-dependent 3-hydroxy acid dehydrogenase YdfG